MTSHQQMDVIVAVVAIVLDAITLLVERWVKRHNKGLD